ncbi:MAG: signal peptidase II [Clostridiales bacterium]|nr:signal peptidase II [Clostridiales bacterium]
MFYILLAAGIFALDYAVKEHVNTTRLQGTKEEKAGGLLILRNCHNKGLAFGLLKDAEGDIPRECSGLALGGAIWAFLCALFKRGSKVVRLGLSMVVGGGLNNYVERRNKGEVTDYVSLGRGGRRLKSLVFNLSDLFVFAGGILWILGSLFPGKKKK